MESNLISTCIVCDSNDVKYSIYELKKLSKNLESSFLYYELIVLVDKSASNEFIQNLNSINNLRILISKTSFNQYEKRKIIALEAIGDFILLTSINELDSINPIKIINNSIKNDSLALQSNGGSSIIEKILFLPLKTLGRILNLHINDNYTKTMVFTRSILNEILNSDYNVLLLRFPPKKFYSSKDIAKTSKKIERNYDNLSDKLSIIYMGLLKLSPKILKFSTIFSLITLLISFFYLAYILFVWVKIENVQSGWITTSLSVSGISIFLSYSFFIITIAIQHLLSKYNKKINEDLYYEISSFNIYEKAKNNLNIEFNNIDA
jgi:hypothetical protein